MNNEYAIILSIYKRIYAEVFAVGLCFKSSVCTNFYQNFKTIFFLCNDWIPYSIFKIIKNVSSSTSHKKLFDSMDFRITGFWLNSF